MTKDGAPSPPRLIYYSDAHHFHFKRLDPPLNLHKMRWPIDELSGTGVDQLTFGLGFADVYFHQTKIGRIIGQEQEVFDGFINWRIMRNVKDAAAMGTDQLREVIKHGRAAGIKVFPSLKLQDPSPQGTERCGWLKWRNGMEVTLGSGDDRFANHKTEWCYDYSNEAVRAEKLSLIREVLEDYQADGIELDFMFFPLYFRQDETETSIPMMNGFMAEVKALAREIGELQSRTIPVQARVWHRREENLGIGLDVEAWIAAGDVDYVVGQVPNMLLDTGAHGSKWLADAANAAGVCAYLRPNRKLDDTRTGIANIEMFRAFRQTAHWHGFAGIYLAYLPWPFADAEYHLLREMAHPTAALRHDKRYFLPPREDLPTYVKADGRQLPLVLEEGVKEAVPIVVGDEIDPAKADDELRDPVLTLTFNSFCVEDEVTIAFNGKNLPIDRKAIYEPRRGTYWMRWTLGQDDVVQGDNSLEIEIVRKEKTAGFARTLTGVEVHMRYTEFDRPESLDPLKIPPPS
jgi:hypothetical protein